MADKPGVIVGALKGAILDGAAPTDLGRALAYAAALRVARFGTSNEFSDWNSALHTFTYANALHRALGRVAAGGEESRNGNCEGVRGIFHGAMALYLNRFLNVPPARIPGERGESLDDLPAEAGALRGLILDAFDRQQQVSASARLVARYLGLGTPPIP